MIVDASVIITLFFVMEIRVNQICMKTAMSIDYVAKEFCNTNMIWRAVYLRRILTIEDVEKIIKLFRIMIVLEIMRNTL
jgi:predicted nucleic acid-binding protein